MFSRKYSVYKNLLNTMLIPTDKNEYAIFYEYAKTTFAGEYNKKRRDCILFSNSFSNFYNTSQNFYECYKDVVEYHLGYYDQPVEVYNKVHCYCDCFNYANKLNLNEFENTMQAMYMSFFIPKAYNYCIKNNIFNKFYKLFMKKYVSLTKYDNFMNHTSADVFFDIVNASFFDMTREFDWYADNIYKMAKYLVKESKTAVYQVDSDISRVRDEHNSNEHEAKITNRLYTGSVYNILGDFSYGYLYEHLKDHNGHITGNIDNFYKDFIISDLCATSFKTAIMYGIMHSLEMKYESNSKNANKYINDKNFDEFKSDMNLFFIKNVSSYGEKLKFIEDCIVFLRERTSKYGSMDEFNVAKFYSDIGFVYNTNISKLYDYCINNISKDYYKKIVDKEFNPFYKLCQTITYVKNEKTNSFKYMSLEEFREIHPDSIKELKERFFEFYNNLLMFCINEQLTLQNIIANKCSYNLMYFIEDVFASKFATFKGFII